jgi:hypothetical protein
MRSATYRTSFSSKVSREFSLNLEVIINVVLPIVRVLVLERAVVLFSAIIAPPKQGRRRKTSRAAVNFEFSFEALCYVRFALIGGQPAYFFWQ